MRAAPSWLLTIEFSNAAVSTEMTMEGLSVFCCSYSKTMAEKKAWEMVKQQSRCCMLYLAWCAA